MTIEPIDLSNYEGPVSQLFTTETDGDCALSQDQIEFFEENGYLAGIDVLNATQIETLREELDKLMQPEQAGNPLFL